MTKILNFKSFVRLSLSCAFAFCASIISCHATDLVDPISGNIVGTYDSSKREVIINSELACFDDQGRLPTDTDFAIQRALHCYPDGSLYNNKSETVNTHAVVIGSNSEGFPKSDLTNFNDNYKFVPKKITFGDVIYQFDYEMENFSNRTQAPVGTLVISTKSTITQHIYVPIIMAFGSTSREDVQRDDCICSGINKIIIIGNFEQIPRRCFKNMPELKSVDASKSQIKRVCPGAFGNNHNSLNIKVVY